MKSCISNGFFDYGDAPLTLFLRLRNFLNNRKSLMTGKRPLIIMVKLCKMLAHFLRMCAEIETF